MRFSALSPDSSKQHLWASRMAEFALFKGSVAQFCLAHNCSDASFYHWKRKLNLTTATFIWCHPSIGDLAPELLLSHPLLPRFSYCVYFNDGMICRKLTESAEGKKFLANQDDSRVI